MKSIACHLRAAFLEADVRGLALFRIAFGLVMLGYLGTRLTDDSFVAFHTNEGVYPNHYALFAPVAPHAWSLLFAVTTRAQVLAMLACFALAFACFTVGYRTRVAQVASLAGLVSLHYRNPFVVNGSMVMMHVLLVWTLALPLGRRLSVDAFLARRRGRASRGPARVTSLAVLGLHAQLAAIYLFNVAHKTGRTWREGSAVHYVLFQDRIARDAAVFLREHEPPWLSPLATYGTLATEALVAICILSPVATTLARRLAAVLMCLFHGTIAVFVDLGPFPFVFPCAALLLLSFGDAPRWMERFAPGVATRRVTAERRLERVAREAYACVLLVAFALLHRHDNPCLVERFGPTSLPTAAQVFAEVFYVPQGWSLFAPEAPREDGVLVVDAVRRDGTHVDPLRRRAPDFRAMEHGPFGTDYLWQTYVPHLVMRHDDSLWRFFVDYVERIPHLERWDGDPRFRSIRVYYVGGTRPAQGERAEPAHVDLLAERVNEGPARAAAP